MGESVEKASACLREALRRRQGRTLDRMSTAISDICRSSLPVPPSDTPKMSNRSPSEALESGLPMAVLTTGGVNRSVTSRT